MAAVSSPAEVASVLRESADQAVVVRGGGTKLSWGAPPRRADLTLDVSGLDRVIDHAAGDLVLVAEAGARLAGVQAVLAKAGQRLAIDEPMPGSTLGGVVSVGHSGPLRLLAGPVKDQIIGVSFVRADGVPARSGGRVVKNVAGYDLGRLLCGSYGTLAVITQLAFRLRPLPAARMWVLLDAPAASSIAAGAGPGGVAAGGASVTAGGAGMAAAGAGMAAAVLRVAGSQLAPSAIELCTAGGLAVLIEGTAEAVAARSAAARALLGSGPVRLADTAPDWWGRLPDGILLRLTFVRSGLADVLAAAADEGLPLRGSAAVGSVCGAFPASTAPEVIAAAVGRLREVCARHGGGVVVLDAPPAVHEAVDVWGPVPGLALMRAVKDRFDPAHRLAPGRFVGGI